MSVPEHQDSSAIAQHAAGDYAAALQQRLVELQGMDQADSRYGGVLGTVALTYERMDRHGPALTYAHEALGTLHREPAEVAYEACLRAPEPSMLINVGTVFLRNAAWYRLNPREEDSVHNAAAFTSIADATLSAAWVRLRHMRPENLPRTTFDQHVLNLWPRLIMNDASRPGESLRGKLGAFFNGVGSAALSGYSESPKTLNHTPGMSGEVRARSQRKHLARSVAAMGVSALSIIGDTKQRDRLILRAA